MTRKALPVGLLAAAVFTVGRLAAQPSGQDALVLAAYAKAPVVISCDLARGQQDFHTHLDHWRTPHVVAKLRVVSALKGDPGGEVVPVEFTRKGLAKIWPDYKKALEGKVPWPERRVILFVGRANPWSTPGARLVSMGPNFGDVPGIWFIDDSPDIESFLAKAGDGCLAAASPLPGGAAPGTAQGAGRNADVDPCDRTIAQAVRSGFLHAATGLSGTELPEIVPNPSRSLCAMDYPGPLDLRYVIVWDARLECAPAWATTERARMGAKRIRVRACGSRNPVWLDDRRFAFLSYMPDFPSDIVYVQDLRSGDVVAERANFQVRSLACVEGRLTAEGWNGESEALDHPCAAATKFTWIEDPDEGAGHGERD